MRAPPRAAALAFALVAFGCAREPSSEMTPSVDDGPAVVSASTLAYLPRGAGGTCPAPYEALSRSCVHPVQRLRRNERELADEVASYERGARAPVIEALPAPTVPAETPSPTATAQEPDRDAAKRERLAALDRMLESLRRQAAENESRRRPVTAAPAPVARKDDVAAPVAPAAAPTANPADADDTRLGELVALLKALDAEEAAKTVAEIEERGLVPPSVDEATWNEIAKNYRTGAPGLKAE